MIRTRISSVGSFKDARGEFVSPWREDDFSGPRWVEDDFSVNAERVLRGIHGDRHTRKLLYCIIGEIFLVIADPDTKEWSSMYLSDAERKTVEIPARYGIGYEVTRGPAVVFYKQSETYGTYPQFSIRWDDPAYGITWPIKDPILSKRDAGASESYADV